VAYVHLHGLDLGPRLHAVELFSGVGCITRACRLEGLRCEPYDIDLDGKMHNMLTTRGFLYALCLVVRLDVNGLLWSGIPCSSWVRALLKHKTVSRVRAK
jgi:hypothetical protein